MPALISTSHAATITWLGYVPDRDRPDITTHALQEMPLTWAGYEGDIHSGVTRPSCSRVVTQYPQRGTEIRNVRQLSIVSAEEMAEIAAELGLDALEPAWLGASVVIEGIPDWSHVPPSARLVTENGTALTVDMQNQPCQFPAKTIERDRPGHGKRFKSVAEGRRGVTAWVERPGILKVGDKLRLHVPGQRAWAPA